MLRSVHIGFPAPVYDGLEMATVMDICGVSVDFVLQYWQSEDWSPQCSSWW